MPGYLIFLYITASQNKTIDEVNVGIFTDAVAGNGIPRYLKGQVEKFT
jgi:hypothetical protein